jgi:aspartyl-tRNA(Asn)/glutamyl-tRNA(Gln) amidotransferase subunit B
LVLAAMPAAIRAVFEEAVGEGAPPTAAANWMSGEVTGNLRKAGSDMSEVPITGRQLSGLIALVEAGTVSATAAKEVLEGVMAGEGEPSEVAEARDLVQVSDRELLMEAVVTVVEANPEVVAAYRGGGEDKVLGFLVGQVMRATQGKADPRIVNQLLRDAITTG